MKALVTGGTGFIGAHIVKHLNAQGHDVRVLMRATSSTAAIDDLDYERAIGDIQDPESLRPAMEGVDWVFHAAASVATWKGAWEASRRVNIIGTRNVAGAAMAAGVKRFVYTSSDAVLGKPADGEIGDESLDWNLPFKLVYNETKRLAEEEVKKAIGRGLQAVLLNPGMVVGERDVNQNVGGLLLEIRNGTMPFIPPGGAGWCDADEVAKAHIAAAERGAVGERYAVTGVNMTYKEIFNIMADILGVKPPILAVPAAVTLAAGKLGDLIGSITKKEPFINFNTAYMGAYKLYYSSDKAVSKLGFRLVPPRESIEKCYKWYLDRRIIKKP